MRLQTTDFRVYFLGILFLIIFLTIYNNCNTFHDWPKHTRTISRSVMFNRSLNHIEENDNYEMENHDEIKTNKAVEEPDKMEKIARMEEDEEIQNLTRFGDDDEIERDGTIQKEYGSEIYPLQDIFAQNLTTEELVPNFVHYIWLDMKGELTFEFLHAVSIISVHKRWKPDTIFLHVYLKNYPHGKWWDYVKNNVSEIKIVEHEFDELTIYGEVPRYVEHMADILRINMLREYGGAYIDTDVVALRSLEPLRHYDHTQGVGILSSGLSNGVIIAKKTSIFLKLWLEAYRTYNKIKLGSGNSFWRYYSIQVPRTLVDIYPHLIHMEKNTLVRPTNKLYTREKVKQFVWENNYSIHVWHKRMKVPKSPGEIKDLPDNSLLKEVMEYIWYDKPPPYR